MNEKPKYLKVLNWIAVFLFVIAAITFVMSFTLEFGILNFFIFGVPALGLGLILWAFNLVYYFKKNDKIKTGNWIFGILLSIFSLILIFSILEKLGIQQFGDVSGQFILPVQIALVVFLAIFLFMLNKK